MWIKIQEWVLIKKEPVLLYLASNQMGSKINQQMVARLLTPTTVTHNKQIIIRHHCDQYYPVHLHNEWEDR